MKDKTKIYDVVVVGCGIAGLSAAVTAHQNGATVAIIERATKNERGGNTRFTESFWRMKSEEAVSDDFEDRFAANAGGWPDPGIIQDFNRDQKNQSRVLRSLSVLDPNLITTIANEAPKTIKWLKQFNIKFDFLPLYFLSQSTTRMGPIGGGLALIEGLGSYADAQNEIDFFYETSAQKLITNDQGAIVGIKAIAPQHQTISIMGKSIVLASGGFEGNPEMLSQYIGAQTQFIRPVSRGGYYNRGEGIRMALNAGAAPSGDYGSFHAQPIDPRSSDIEPVVLNYSYGILINDSGRRFTDEAPDMVDITYEIITRLIMKQRNGIAYAVFDKSLEDIANWPITVRSKIPPIQSNDLPSLAEKLNVDKGQFLKTIDDYNRSAPNSTDFDPLKLDGLATTGLIPQKSNWSRSIQQPPFSAWPIICSNCFTFGGIKIDDKARAINTEGDIIPGLYVTGEAAGIYYRVYTGATSVMRGAVTGRLAGRDAALRRNTNTQ